MNIVNRKNILTGSAIIIFFGFLLRFYQLNFEDYWLDEMLSFWVADPNISINDTFNRSKHIDQSPPLFNIVLKKYLEIFSYKPEIARQVPLIFGVLSIPLLGILSYQVSKNNSFFLTIILVSINIYLIKYSQETRPYSLVFLLSILNLIFFNKIISSNFDGIKKIFFFSIFIFFSVLALSSHPFVFIILFSQIGHFIYSFLVFRNRNYLFILSVPIIIFLYLIINYDYLISQLGYKEYFLEKENWKFYYNYYFSRFFGSKIMGLIYLSSLIFLIINFRKKIFFTSNNYLVLFFILISSYLIPLLYGIIKFPVLTDRYIIFVLIPIIILVSTLIFEIKKKKIKFFLIIFILLPTLINNYIEIQYRKNTKPEFTNLLNDLQIHEFQNMTLYGSSRELKLVNNYIMSLDEFQINEFKLLNIESLKSNKQTLWFICYEPLLGFSCTVPLTEQTNKLLLETKKFHLLKAELYQIIKY